MNQTVPPPQNSVVSEGKDLLTINIHDSEFVVGAIPGVDVVPLNLDPQAAVWILYVRMAPNTQLPTHFHTGQVHLYTTKGSWYYLEHQEKHNVQRAGSYLFEPAGSYHTFRSDEGTEFFNVVFGANINFDDKGQFINIMDAGWIAERVRAASQEAGQKPPRYVVPAGDFTYTRT